MRRIKPIISATLAAAMLATSFVGFSSVASAATMLNQTIEAETGVLADNPKPEKPYVTKLATGEKIKLGSMEYALIAGNSGTGAVAITNNPAETTDLVSFTVDVPACGKFDITITAADVYSSEGRKNALMVNDGFWDYFYTEDEGWTDYTIKNVYLKAGKNKLSIRRYTTCDGNIFFDKIKLAQTSVETPGSYYNVKPTLCNAKSNDTTKRLFSYLCDTYGKQTITGQFSDSGTAREIKAIEGATGKTPAIVGFDLMNYTTTYAKYLPQQVQKLKTTQNVISWVNESNGIATLTWHWYAPDDYIKNDSWTVSYSNNVLYTKPTAAHPKYFNLKEIMNGQNEDAYNVLIRDIDLIAAELKTLQNNNVSVLWRPLHEAGGNETAKPWFWWGQDKDSYIKLWKLVYDRLTNYHGLNNLIWVWNGQDPDWYPGDEYCDIIGWDVYPEKFDYTASSNRFWQATAYPKKGNKIVALSENGTMPSLDQMIANDTMWSYFCTWSGEFVINKTATYAENYTSKEELNKLYNSDKTITLDELPSNLYTTYPIGDGGDPIPSGDRKYGDVNNDGNIDVIDVSLMRAHIVSTKELEAEDLLYADVNSDGNLDIIDVVMVRKIIVG